MSLITANILGILMIVCCIADIINTHFKGRFWYRANDSIIILIIITVILLLINLNY